MRTWPLIIAVLVAGCTNPSTGSGDVKIADIHGLALDPQHPTRLYVATHHGLFVAENDTAWAAVTRDPFDMMGFTMHPNDGRIMYASGHPSRAGQGWAVGVLKSTDAGRTWNTLALKNQVDFHAMTMEAGAADRVYGVHGGKVHQSADGGKTWSAKTVGFSVSSLAVDPVTGDVLAATEQGIQRIGRDLAGSWTLLAPGNAIGVATVPGRILGYFAQTGLAASRDGGRSWTSLNWTVPADDHPWGIAAAADPGIVYAGTARGTIHKTTDGGQTWNRIR